MNAPIQGLPQQTFDNVTSTGSAAPSASDGNFLDSLHSAVNQVQQLQSEADNQVSSLVSGNGQDVHSAMIAVEKANLTFELMVQVRNKIVSAYQEVSKMAF
jgi:flagellar hook-basal body complex protein FliE